jgi:hypothetical protein
LEPSKCLQVPAATIVFAAVPRIVRLRAVHHLSDQQIFARIGATSTLCRLEEKQAILLQLSAAVQKLAQAPVDVDANAAAFRKSWLFRLW